MRVGPWFFASGALLLWVVSVFSCNTPTTGDKLTVTHTAVTVAESVASSAATGGMGGAGGVGGAGGIGGAGGGTGGKGGAGGKMAASSSSGKGGSGGIPEDPVNGCLSSKAVDLTGAGANVTISATYNIAAVGKQLDPKNPMCLMLKFNQKITMQGTGVQGGPIIVGGAVDMDGIASYDNKSPIQPNCFNGNTFDPNSASCYNGGVWPCANAACQAFTIQAYPWYNNSKKDSEKGALYVVP